MVESLLKATYSSPIDIIMDNNESSLAEFDNIVFNESIFACRLEMYMSCFDIFLSRSSSASLTCWSVVDNANTSKLNNRHMVVIM